MSLGGPTRPSKPRHSRPTKVPGIPKPPASASPELKRYLEQLSEAVQIRLGRQGDPRDRAVTLRELINSGLATDLSNRPFNPENAGQGPGTDPDFGTGTGGLPGPTDPQKPTSFTAVGAYSTVIMNWDFPAYYGHALTEIWFHTDDVLADAVLLTVTPSNVHVHACGNGEAFYYWIRFVSETGAKGAWFSLSGVYAETAIDVIAVLNVINGQITTDELALDLAQEINRVDVLDKFIGVSNPLPGTLANLININTANIIPNGLQRLNNLETALRLTDSKTTTVVGVVDSLSTQVTGSGGTVERLDGLYASTYVNGDPQQPLLSSTYTDAIKTAVDQDIGALATRINTLQASVIDSTTGLPVYATVQQLSTVKADVDGVQAKHTIKLNSRGAIAGIGLMAEADRAGALTSAVYIQADRFALVGRTDRVNASGDPEPQTVPFVVYTNPTIVDGNTIQPGVYIKYAAIQDLSIDTAKVKELSGDRITVDTLNGNKITTGTISAGKLMLGQGADITSDGYGRVLIKDLSVSTLKIQGEAVVVPRGVNTSSRAFSGSSWATIGTVYNVNAEGGKTFVTFTATAAFNGDWDGSLRILQNNVVKTTEYFRIRIDSGGAYGAVSLTISYMTTAYTGNQEFKIQGTAAGQNGGFTLGKGNFSVAGYRR